MPSFCFSRWPRRKKWYIDIYRGVVTPTHTHTTHKLICLHGLLCSHLATFTREHCLSARRGLLHHLKSYSLLLKIPEENQNHASRGYRWQQAWGRLFWSGEHASLLFNGIVLGSPGNACFLLQTSVAPAWEASEIGTARSTRGGSYNTWCPRYSCCGTQSLHMVTECKVTHLFRALIPEPVLRCHLSRSLGEEEMRGFRPCNRK